MLKLLNVLRGRTTGTSFKESPAVYQRNNRQHLGTRTKLHDGKEVCEVVAQHIARYRNGVQALTNTIQRDADCVGRRHDVNLKIGRVVFGQVTTHFGNHLGVVGTIFVKPENSGVSRESGTIDRELDPVGNRHVLGLAHTEDVVLGDGNRKDDLTRTVGHHNGAVMWDFKGLVVAAILFGRLRHQPNIRYRPHGGRIKCAESATVIEGHLIDTGVAGIRQNGQGVGLLPGRVPHVTRGADHRRHRGVHNHVVGGVQVCYALIGVDHRECGTVSQLAGEGSLNGIAISQPVQSGVNAGQSVVRIEAGISHFAAELREGFRKERSNHMAKHDGV